MITIINYGIGNLESVQNMLRKCSIESRISNKQEEIEQAEKLILPGVGHFDHCMQKLTNSGLLPIIEKKVKTDKIPTLGICVGHQMLFEHSEEGDTEGLGWISGKVVKFDQIKMPSIYKIPHMGWADLTLTTESVLFKNIEEPRYYFVHSYHVNCEAKYVLATASHGYDFVAAVQKNNIYGVQFHPEKSHKFGMQLFRNFNDV